MPLSELRGYLDVNKHLPGIPGAAELEANGGVQLGAMQRDLVRTVEEQALYILVLEREQQDLRRMLVDIHQRLKSLEVEQH